MRTCKATVKGRGGTFGGAIAALAVLAGCASQPVDRMRPLEPYTYLQLRNCKVYPGFSECRLMLLTQYGPVSFGPVQMRGRSSNGPPAGYQYQVLGCAPVQRAVPLLPNYNCEISEISGGLSAGTVLVKGGTAVRLAKHFGDIQQLNYRWKKDPWSRVDG